MLGKQPFELVFASGVVRFDSAGNLFINLPHTDEDPMPVVIGPDGGKIVRAPERRARVHGPAESGPCVGAFPGSGDLPRGLTIEVKGYSDARFEAGALVVRLPAETTVPSWFEAGSNHRFARPGDALRLWVKSSFPDGVTLQDASSIRAAPPTQPKPVARAQFQPESRAPEPAPPAAAAPEAERPAPSPAPPPNEPYRPERLAAGHLGTGSEQRGKGLGCSTLLVVAVLGALGSLSLV